MNTKIENEEGFLQTSKTYKKNDKPPFEKQNLSFDLQSVAKLIKLQLFIKKFLKKIRGNTVSENNKLKAQVI